MSTANHPEIKDAIINSASEQIRGLLETHFPSISKSATENFIDSDDQPEPKAKANLTVEFDPLAQAPAVRVKITRTTRYTDESEQEIDPLQSKLGFKEEDEE